MNNRVVIVRQRFVEGTATVNRTFGYAKGFAELKKDVHVVFLFPNLENEKYNKKIQNVTFHYLWDKIPRFLLKFKLSTYFIIIIKYVLFLKKNDFVLLLGGFVIPYYFHPFRRTCTFCETTEHPFVDNNVRFKHKLMELFFLKMIKKTKGLFVISNSLKDYYSKFINPDMIYISNMFVDFTRFLNCNTFNKNEKYIAYCGTLSNYKDGIDILIHSFAIFHQKYPEFKLYIIGEKMKNEIEWQKIKTIINDKNLSNNIIFTGKVMPDEMPILLCKAMILALARPNNVQAKNGFPTKLGEYLCTGNPVVITRTGDINIFLKDKINCIFAEPDNINDFAEKLIWTIENYNEAKIIGLKGKEQALNAFSYKKQTEKVMKIMEEKSLKL
ncbi:MAG: glycosyltransferase family 4 protein [Bacteroidales bacterium]|jgi:glycosyltransferase involved in cell wall biosynthesis